jgi:HPt (histidine-containing phosphotransfer) domain-containing protein
MNSNLQNHFASPFVSFIGFSGLLAITVFGVLAHGANTTLLNHMMGAVVLGLNLFYLLILQYQNIKFWKLRKLFAYQYQEVLDYAVMNELRVLTTIEFHSIIKHYRKITPELLHDLNDAIVMHDTHEISRLARRIRSASLQIGAIKFALAAQEIEYHANNKNLRGLPKLFRATANAYNEVQSELEIISH